MATIAFIGLGNMGGPMSANLIKAGHRVRGFDLVPALLKTAEGAGVEPVRSSAEAVAGADVVITMLPAAEHALRVWTEVLPAVRPRTLLDRKSTRLNSSHVSESRMPSS